MPVVGGLLQYRKQQCKVFNKMASIDTYTFLLKNNPYHVDLMKGFSNLAMFNYFINNNFLLDNCLSQYKRFTLSNRIRPYNIFY